MIKFYSLIFLAFLVFTNAQAQSNDWLKMNLKGSPKQLVEMTIDDGGKEEGRTEYNFNSNGFLGSEIRVFFIFGQKVVAKSVYTYNENQSLQSIINYEQGKLKGKMVYSYANNATKVTEYDASGKLIKKDLDLVEIQEGEPSEIIVEKNQQDDVVTSYTLEKDAEAGIPNLPYKNVTVLENSEYKYDSKNNWISVVSKVLSVGESEPFVAKRVKRTIVYY